MGFMGRFFPIFESEKEDVDYVLREAAKVYPEMDKSDPATREYVSRKLRQHGISLKASKLMDSFDRAGLFFAGEDYIEGVLKAVLAVAQGASVLGDREIRERNGLIDYLTTLSKYTCAEVPGVIPVVGDTVGEVPDMLNLYVNELRKYIASAVTPENIETYQIRALGRGAYEGHASITQVPYGKRGQNDAGEYVHKALEDVRNNPGKALKVTDAIGKAAAGILRGRKRR